MWKSQAVQLLPLQVLMLDTYKKEKAHVEILEKNLLEIYVLFCGTFDIVPSGKMLVSIGNGPNYKNISTYNSSSSYWISGYNSAIINPDTISKIYYKNPNNSGTIYVYKLTEDLSISTIYTCR